VPLLSFLQSGVLSLRPRFVGSDGREFDIVKVFYDAVDLEHRLVQRGWNGSVRTTGMFFLHGLMTVFT
jgi:hypothetical protein